LLLTVLVAAAATAAGLWIASRVTASLRRLTDAAEHVEQTGRLDVEVGERGDDEVGRLGGAFDRMLAALRRSREEQHRLVQDAGHELRTPLTSLRTNIDTLQRFPGLDADGRKSIIADLDAETEELTDLVNEIVAVASGLMSNEPAELFDLAELTTDVAARYERRTGREIVVTATSGSVIAQRAAVQRAISCLLDNARKFDESGGPIEVCIEISGGVSDPGQMGIEATVTVADRGVGIPPQDVDLVFERFHRSDEARAMPGSGLGLSIVNEVAVRHGGEAFARSRIGGGAEVGFRLVGPPHPAPDYPAPS
jgi:two-component system sensor histidine kinase MprB